MTEFPRFSDAEYARRHAALGRVMERAEVDHLLIVTDHRAGNAPQWVTGWPGTVEAYVVFKPGEPIVMHVEWFNHVPLARRIAHDVDVRWGEHRGMGKTIEELNSRGAKRVGLIGPLVVAKYHALANEFDVVLLDGEYVRLRLVKSEEEVEWLRKGAALSDAGFQALLVGTKPGMNERALANQVERAYVGQGGTTFIHYIGVTSMRDPHICVPPQFPSDREIKVGDVVFCELSASWWDYTGQVLRTFTVGAEATGLYRELYATAEAAFDGVTSAVKHGATARDLLHASRVIEDRGFTIYDDLVHGFGGGYFPPIIGSKSRPAGPLPDFTLEENMTIVVQPNVVTPDHKAGVQVGELIRVTKTGFERLHTAPRGLLRAA